MSSDGRSDRLSAGESASTGGSGAGRHVWDWLADPASYTGVYAERMRSGPGINHDSDSYIYKQRTTFEGHTNTGSNEVIRDISQITRPNLNPYPRSPPELPRERRDRTLHAAREGSALPTAPFDTNAQLQLIFQYYCRFGRTGGRGDEEDTIDNVNFAKFARECPGLVDERLDRTEVDLIFTKCKKKHERRLTYSQFLDALAAMAAAKFPAEDIATAFALLLSRHVFNSPPAVGMQAALARRAASARDMAAAAAGYASSAPEHAPASVPREGSAASMARGMSGGAGWVPAADEKRVGGAPLPATASLASLRASGAPGAPGAGIPDVSSGAYPQAHAYASYTSTPSRGRVAVAPPPLPAHSSAGAAAGGGGSGGRGASPSRPPAAARGEDPLSLAQAEAARAVADIYAKYGIDVRGPAPTSSAAVPAPSGSGVLASPPTTASVVDSGVRPRATVSAVAATVPHVPLDHASAMATGRLLAEEQAASYGLGPDRRSPRLAAGARAAAALRASKLGAKDFRPTIAGEANRPGSVFDRLASPESFTGVYRRAWLTDGRINAFADTGVSAVPSEYEGHTNTGSNETIHDIRTFLRPNVRLGKTFK